MTRAQLATVLCVGAVASVAAGCGGSSSGGSSTPSSSGPAVAAKKTSLGTILTDGSGRTLYLFEKDTGPKSACSGKCASDWPPFTATSKPAVSGGASGSDVKLVKRSDGQMQVTYKGHPLYFYSGDKSPGQTNGQGLKVWGAEWYVLSPAGSKVEGKESGGGGNSGGYGGGY